MASTNKTEHLQLNQWVGTDPFRMADFNEDNAKLDAAVKANADAIASNTQAITALQSGGLKIAVGSYAGSGTFGQANPKTLTVGFKPKYVRILCTEKGVVNHFYSLEAISGVSGATIYGNYANSSFQKPVTLTWLDNGISWYSTENATYQMNNTDFVYYYMMLG